MKFFTKLRDGYRYMKTWPMVKQLGYFFPEYRVVKATQIAIFSMPLIAVLVSATQLYIVGWDALPQAIIYSLFFLSLPIQGLIWLGWRAKHPLPLSLFSWGQKLSEKISAAGVECKPLTSKACYFDMAVLLKVAFEQLDNSYWEEL
ncbi:terminus macrodomain insulation protein YfbV [Parashewanella curva]|nr:terminus macrodomain insulation protein YfbV [Parashewanella curva]